jgi:hypothetical protein
VPCCSLSHGSLLLCLPDLRPAPLPAATLPPLQALQQRPRSLQPQPVTPFCFCVFPRAVPGASPSGAQLASGTLRILRDLLDISRGHPLASQRHRPFRGGERGRDVWARAASARGPCLERERDRVSFLLVLSSLCLSPAPYHPSPPSGTSGLRMRALCFSVPFLRTKTQPRSNGVCRV